MRTQILVPLAAILALAGCTPHFDGPEKVKTLRLLAVQAEPPEIGAAVDGSGPSWPASSATIRSLVAHPNYAVDSTPQALILHLGCTPAPGDPTGTACTEMSELSDPADLLQFVSMADACTDPGSGQVDAITFSGLEVCDRDGCGPFSVPLDPAQPATTVAMPAPGYLLPTDFSLASLPAGNPQRVIGLDVVDVALVVEATPSEVAPTTAVTDACQALGAVLSNLEALWPARANVAALKWIHVRGPDMPAASAPNHNPTVAGILFDGQSVPAFGFPPPLPVTAGKEETLLPDFGTDSYETLREQYERFDTDGNYIDTEEETWAYSWFSTGGDLDQPFTDSTNPPNKLTPAKGPAAVWLVVRDLRGGMAWTSGEISAP